MMPCGLQCGHAGMASKSRTESKRAISRENSVAARFIIKRGKPRIRAKFYHEDLVIEFCTYPGLPSSKVGRRLENLLREAIAAARKSHARAERRLTLLMLWLLSR